MLEDLNLSVIIPCYNEFDTIENIVQAVIDATSPDREIIIVDDYSTDGTRAYLKKFSDTDKIKVWNAIEKEEGETE